MDFDLEVIKCVYGVGEGSVITMSQSTEFRVRHSGVSTLLAVLPFAAHSTSLSFKVLIHKIGIMSLEL